LSVYIDTSAAVALFLPDPLSARANTLVAAQRDPLVVSDYVALEFASSVMRLTRAKVVALKTAKEALAEFDAWAATSCERAETMAADIATAAAFVRRDGVALRTSDAVNVAIAERLGAALLTFDKKLASNARRLGLAIA
jgi:hypothetical protein